MAKLVFLCTLVLIHLALQGCSGLKEVTLEGYELSADSVSAYCAKSCGQSPTINAAISEERRKTREEIQERGKHGQLSPWGNSGPVIAVWCNCDAPVPEAVWQYIYDDPLP